MILQDDLIAATATPPMYLQTDLQTFDLHELPTKFDVILVEPPLEEYQHTGVTNVQFWDWQKIMDLDIAQVRVIASSIVLYVIIFSPMTFPLYISHMSK